MMPAPSDIILDRMMSLHPKVIDLTLDRVWRLLDALGNPQDRLPPVIHLAGTNGKGSVQAMMRAGLEGAGYRAHAYTSPHLARFHERIRVDGSLIDEETLADVLDECERANGSAPITYFEITTCAALLAFSRVPADFTLLEVGLGGRLDATNVITSPRLTIITPVSIDHQQFLGETLPEIAFEKAGILKRGVTCIVGHQEQAALDVIEAQAGRLGAPLSAAGQHWHVESERGRLVFHDETGLCDLPLPNLRGPHQIRNAGIALAALRALGEGETACEAAVTTASWPARMQRLESGPLVDAAQGAELWLDGGHNAAAGLALAASLSEMNRRPTVLVCGMLNTKDVGGYLRPLASVADRLVAVSIPGETNTLSAEDTRAAAAASGMTAETADSLTDAIRSVSEAGSGARILICGSLYLAGAVLRENA